MLWSLVYSYFATMRTNCQPTRHYSFIEAWTTSLYVNEEIVWASWLVGGDSSGAKRLVVTIDQLYVNREQLDEPLVGWLNYFWAVVSKKKKKRRQSNHTTNKQTNKKSTTKKTGRKNFQRVQHRVWMLASLLVIFNVNVESRNAIWHGNIFNSALLSLVRWSRVLLR